jgi:hypothetical protein
MRAARTLILLVFSELLAGCIMYTDVSHRAANKSEMLTITKTQHGLILGPCGFVSGGKYVAGEITLEGRKEKYVDGDFRVVFPTDTNGAAMRHDASGVISVDWKTREVKIDLMQWWIGNPSFKWPCGFNGSYRFTEEKTPK